MRWVIAVAALLGCNNDQATPSPPRAAPREPVPPTFAPNRGRDVLTQQQIAMTELAPGGWEGHWSGEWQILDRNVGPETITSTITRRENGALHFKSAPYELDLAQSSAMPQLAAGIIRKERSVIPPNSVGVWLVYVDELSAVVSGDRLTIGVFYDTQGVDKLDIQTKPMTSIIRLQRDR